MANRRNTHGEDLTLFILAVVAVFCVAYFAMSVADDLAAKALGFVQ